MRQISFRYAAVAACLFASVDATAQSSFLNTSNIEAYCQNAAPRQTVVLIDETIVPAGNDQWARQILNKLQFVPRERVQVVKLKPDGAAEQLFSLCYPQLTAAEETDIRRREGVGDRLFGSKLDDVKKAREQFERGFRIALSSFIQAGKPPERMRISASSVPEKSLVESLFYDEKRFAIENGVSRVVIFSDMLQRSSSIDVVGSQMDPARLALDAARRFQIRFNLAEVHVFGIGSSLPASDPLNRKMEAFWRSYFLKNGAFLEQYSANLSMGETDSFEISRWRGALILRDRHLEASLRVMTNKGGALFNSWLVIAGVGVLPVSGKFRCGIDGTNQCEIDGELRTNVDPFKEGDKLQIRGSSQEIKGKLKPPRDDEVFPDGSPAVYEIGFKRDDALKL